MPSITFTINGKPQPKHRHRSSVRNGRVFTYPDPRQKAAEDAIIRHFMELPYVTRHKAKDMPLIGKDIPTVVSICMSYKRPKSSKLYAKTTKPDIDNCVKLICDSLNGYAWYDDSQIIHITAQKRFDREEGTEVCIHW